MENKLKNTIVSGLIVSIVGGLILAEFKSETFRNYLADGWGLLKNDHSLPLWAIIALYIAGLATPILFYFLNFNLKCNKTQVAKPIAFNVR